MLKKKNFTSTIKKRDLVIQYTIIINQIYNYNLRPFKTNNIIHM